MEKLPLFYGGVPVAAAGGRGGQLVAVDEVTRGDFTHFHSTSFKNKGKTKSVSPKQIQESLPKTC